MAEDTKEKTIIRKFLLFFDGSYMIDPIVDISTYTLGLCDLEIVDQKLKVTLRRPGLLIGKAGSTIDKLKKFLECDVIIEEKKFI
jgi:ribosomal protein S3